MSRELMKLLTSENLFFEGKKAEQGDILDAYLFDIILETLRPFEGHDSEMDITADTNRANSGKKTRTTVFLNFFSIKTKKMPR